MKTRTNSNPAWLLLTLIASAMLFSWGCTDPNSTGEEVLPKDDLISGQYVDTFSIGFTTLLVDSVNTNQLSTSLIGNYVDEEFGHLFAETYFQTLITGSNLQFGENPENLSLDSIVLSLDLSGFYGRYNDPLELEIFEVTESIPDTGLSSVSSIGFDDSYDYANGYTLDFSDLTGYLDFINIRLDDSLGRKILYAPTDSLLNNTVFLEFFKGLMIRTKPVNPAVSREPGGIFQLDLLSDRTYISLHYKDTTSARSYNFLVSTSSHRYHRIQRQDFTGRLVETVVNNSTAPTEQAYGAVQAGGLIRLFLDVPTIASIDPAGINRAELILPVDPDFFGSDDRFEPPAELFAFLADSTGTGTYDDLILSSASYDAVNQQYSIALTNNLQSILAGRLPANGFILVPGENGITLNRAILCGPNHPDPNKRPKFRVVYTTLPE